MQVVSLGGQRNSSNEWRSETGMERQTIRINEYVMVTGEVCGADIRPYLSYLS